jgi:hypothetical protein
VTACWRHWSRSHPETDHDLELGTHGTTVPGEGAKIVLMVDGEWCRTRLFRSHEQAQLVGAMRTRGRCLRGSGGRDRGRARGHQRPGARKR